MEQLLLLVVEWLTCAMACVTLLLLLQVCYTMGMGQFGTAVEGNFYHALNKALQKRDPPNMQLLRGCHTTHALILNLVDSA